jgi:AcrR family transcriptional regulator
VEIDQSMAVASPAKRVQGRPRQFSDDVVFMATAEAVATFGYRGLTMAAVANLVGCTGPALIHRYGSKQGLLLGYLDWSIARSNDLFERVRRDLPSPLDAIRARFADPHHRHTNDDAAHLSHVIFFVEGRTDRAFIPQMERYASALTSGTERLAEAIELVELRPVPADELARVIVAAVIGASLMWSPLHETTLSDSVGQVISAILKPHLAA